MNVEINLIVKIPLITNGDEKTRTVEIYENGVLVSTREEHLTASRHSLELPGFSEKKVLPNKLKSSFISFLNLEISNALAKKSLEEISVSIYGMYILKLNSSIIFYLRNIPIDKFNDVINVIFSVLDNLGLSYKERIRVNHDET